MRKIGGTSQLFSPRPRNRIGINRLCTRAPKPAIKTGQLSILVVRKPVHRVRTPLPLGQKEIVPLDPPIIIIHNSAKKTALSLADLGIHSTSNVTQLSKPILKIRRAKHCKSSFMLPTSTILEALWLSVYHLIVCPLSKGKKDSWPRETALTELPVRGHIDRYSTNVSVDISTDAQPICRSIRRPRSTYRPSVDRYVGQHIGRASVDMSTDTSVEYRSISRPIYRSRGAQNTHDPGIAYPLSIITRRMKSFAPNASAQKAK